MKTNTWAYIDSIPEDWDEETKQWYKAFIGAYYFQKKQSMDTVNMPVSMRRALYNNYRAVKRCPFNKSLVDYWENVDD